MDSNPVDRLRSSRSPKPSFTGESAWTAERGTRAAFVGVVIGLVPATILDYLRSYWPEASVALGCAAVRAGYSVRFIHMVDFFKTMNQPSADNLVDKALRSFFSPNLLLNKPRLHLRSMGRIAVVLAVILLGCSGPGGLMDLGGDRGKCHHIATAEVLDEVRDANGNLWKVQRANEVILEPIVPPSCAVPMEAALGPGQRFSRQGVLYLSDKPGETIRVEGLLRGMHILDRLEYEWR